MTDTWTRALQIATAAAQEAGHLLRAEFYRPEGPRGAGSHADVDDEAEAVIRARLLAEFPDWSYWGEETVPHKAADENTFWLVDPNDGTAAFLRGFRGSAVSIALIHQARPVLGVVYAPTAPDDAGDLFTWAEGCGPLRRNGVPVERACPPIIDETSVIIISQDADRAPGANLACCAPARFRSVPSIAYRCALVAAGEGEAAVGLYHPQWLDVAGGHALLRAVGGEVTDEAGRPLTYPRFASGAVEWALGGHPALAATLAQRDWLSVLREAEETREDLPFPVHLTIPHLPLPQGLLARAQGCLLGQLAGDSLGGLVEFRHASQIGAGPRLLENGGHWDLLAGQPTDDSEMALCLARCLVRRQGFEREAVLEAYRAWYDSRPFDIGMTTMRALRPRDAHDPSPDSQANGALMRISPLAIATWGQGLRGEVADDASLTHPHATCVEASQVFVAAIHEGLRGGSRQSMHIAALTWANDLTRPTLEAADYDPPEDYSTHQGWVLTALHNAFYRLLHSDSLEEVVVETVRCGGDTDTNACIAGALAGAYFGREGVPPQWRRMVLSCRPHGAHAAAKRTRPSFLWPVDALDLAERLAALGAA